jgi:hypothetical protein
MNAQREMPRSSRDPCQNVKGVKESCRAFDYVEERPQSAGHYSHNIGGA